MKRFWAIVLLSLLAFTSKAGDGKYQMLFVANPSLEWVFFRNNFTGVDFNSIWGTKASYNGGFEYRRYLDPSISISTGINYQNKGFRNKQPFFTDVSEERTGITVGDMHMLVIPVYVNIHQRLRRRLELTFTGGVSGGYLFAERVRNRFYTSEDIPETSLLSGLDESNVNLFNDYFFSADLGVGLVWSVRSRILLEAQPMFKFQVHDAVDPIGQLFNGDLFSMHMCSFGVNLKAGWNFSKQIRNRRKDA